MEDATLVQPATTNLVMRSLETNATYPLAGEMLVGREVECAISLNSGHISRYHSKITISPNGIFIEDLKSTNGTYVNGQRISQRTRICMGDEVAFHTITFRIVTAISGDADATLLGGQPAMTTPTEPAATQSEPSPSAAQTFSPTDTNPLMARADVAQQDPKESGENTQILSASYLSRLITRSQRAQKEVHAGSGARLIVMTAPLRGKVYSLDDARMGTQWHIGRDDDCDIQINDKTISGHHAKLSKIPNGYLISATAAKNGVIINGKSESRFFLSHNDKIQLGRIELVFKSDKAREQDAPDEDDLLSEQLKSTRRLVIGAIATLTLLVIATIISTM